MARSYTASRPDCGANCVAVERAAAEQPSRDLTWTPRVPTMHRVARRKRYLFVCANRRPDGTPKGSCAQRGSAELHAALKAELVARNLAQAEVRACTSSCLDTCWAGPTIAVLPDGYFYGRVRPEDVTEIVDALAAGRRVERLVLGPEDFDMSTALPGLPMDPPREGEP